MAERRKLYIKAGFIGGNLTVLPDQFFLTMAECRGLYIKAGFISVNLTVLPDQDFRNAGNGDCYLSTHCLKEPFLAGLFVDNCMFKYFRYSTTTVIVNC